MEGVMLFSLPLMSDLTMQVFLLSLILRKRHAAQSAALAAQVAPMSGALSGRLCWVLRPPPWESRTLPASARPAFATNSLSASFPLLSFAFSL